ncbi:glycosyltransferase family 2 protein [Vibrio breoganii]|uniref:glycosyltransferase family 2 protein n=1 Tax=Vibrio breoganii TaxID=553239 RepID=UPI000C85C7A8|nr:glycosyltransferase family 2 protein [Vibrio breoganii]PMG94756.1 hypothetical protein BCU80_06175 [Vibrio breoganii]
MSEIITVCIPTFNRSEKLVKALASVLSVSHSDLRVIVYDNCSDDDTWEELKKIEDNRLSVFRQEYNKGFCRNLIDVVSKAQSKYIYLLSDDDIIEPSYIDEILSNNFLSKNEIGLIYSSIYDSHNESYYLKYKDNEIDASSIGKVLFKHSYMTGMLLNKDAIDFEFIEQLLEEERNLLYPHEIMVFTILAQGYKSFTHSDISCYQGIPGKSYIVDECAYYFFRERVKLIEMYKRMIDGYALTSSQKRESYKSLANFSAYFLLKKSPLIWGDCNRTRNRFSYFISISKLQGFSHFFLLSLIKRSMITLYKKAIN